MLWNFRLKKSIQGTRTNCSHWKVQRSFKFVFHIFSLSSRSKVLVFVWLIHGAARWPHMAERPLFYEPAPPAVLSFGVPTSYLLCLPYPGCSVQPGEKRKTLIWSFQGMLQILGDKIIRLTRDYTDFQQENMSEKIIWGFKKNLDSKCIWYPAKHPY